MADISNLITVGIGDPGSVKFLITSGLGIGSPSGISERVEAKYRLDLYDADGNLRAVLTLSAASAPDGSKSGALSLAYTRRVNAPGFVQFALRGDHELIGELSPGWRVEVWRDPAGQGWRREIAAIYRQPEWSFGDRKILVCLCPGLMSLLERRIVNWPANVANRTRFINIPGETIAKILVDYNAGPNATSANGRKRDGAIAGLSVQADGGGGNLVDWYCAQENLLKTLQKLALVAGGDFDLAATGPTTCEFRFYAGQLGVDRSAEVTFAIERGNMANVRYRNTRIDERTVACVWGQGEDADRDYATVIGPGWSSGNDIEAYINANDIDFGDTAGLQTRGDQAMQELRARDELEFAVLQVPSTLYGVHYNLGDLVSVRNPITGLAVTLKMVGVTVSFDPDGREKVQPEFATP